MFKFVVWEVIYKGIANLIKNIVIVVLSMAIILPLIVGGAMIVGMFIWGVGDLIFGWPIPLLIDECSGIAIRDYIGWGEALSHWLVIGSVVLCAFMAVGGFFSMSKDWIEDKYFKYMRDKT